MAVTIHVNGKSNSLVHKGSTGITKCTLPDVCKTPSPGGPVPVPYPIIISLSSDLVKGTKTVKVDGKKMAAIKGSELSRCTGDEPGTAGGVKSSTNMKEATWLLYSFDVKMEGKNACRLTDKMQMNHGNTVCLAGIQQVPVLAPSDDPECTVACAIICCDEAKYKKTPHADSGTKKGSTLDCTSLSTTKHSCVLHSLRKKTEGGSLTTTNKFDNIQASPPMTACGGTVNVIPDIVVNGNHVIDCKFPCDTTKPSAPLNMQQCKSARISAKGKGSMPTPKEDTIYPEIDGMEEANVEGMTPLDAEKRVKENGCPACDCKYEDA